jgi:hypothetical protein
LADVEAKLKQKAWLHSKAQAEAIAAHDLEIAKRQKEIRELGKQAEALNAQLAGAKA